MRTRKRQLLKKCKSFDINLEIIAEVINKFTDKTDVRQEQIAKMIGYVHDA